MSTARLIPKGVLWRDLSAAEKDEIQLQIKNIQFDPNYVNYRYYKTRFHKWIICNAMTVPMQLKKSIWV
jgi:hypothetical protein